MAYLPQAQQSVPPPPTQQQQQQQQMANSFGITINVSNTQQQQVKISGNQSLSNESFQNTTASQQMFNQQMSSQMGLDQNSIMPNFDVNTQQQPQTFSIDISSASSGQINDRSKFVSDYVKQELRTRLCERSNQQLQQGDGAVSGVAVQQQQQQTSMMQQQMNSTQQQSNMMNANMNIQQQQRLTPNSLMDLGFDLDLNFDTSQPMPNSLNSNSINIGGNGGTLQSTNANQMTSMDSGGNSVSISRSSSLVSCINIYFVLVCFTLFFLYNFNRIKVRLRIVFFKSYFHQELKDSSKCDTDI